MILFNKLWNGVLFAVNSMVSNTNIIDFSKMPKGGYPSNRAVLVTLLFGHLMNYLQARHLSPFWVLMIIPIVIYIIFVVYWCIIKKANFIKINIIYFQGFWWIILLFLAACLFFQWRLNTTGELFVSQAVSEIYIEAL
jgi:hypothetical protein